MATVGHLARCYNVMWSYYENNERGRHIVMFTTSNNWRIQLHISVMCSYFQGTCSGSLNGMIMMMITKRRSGQKKYRQEEVWHKCHLEKQNRDG